MRNFVRKFARRSCAPPRQEWTSNSKHLLTTTVLLSAVDFDGQLSGLDCRVFSILSKYVTHTWFSISSAGGGPGSGSCSIKQEVVT